MSDRIFRELNEDKRVVILWAIALLLGLVMGSARANAQMNSEPWGFQEQNRASIAALMQQVEGRNENAGLTDPASYSNDVLVCGGGGGSSSATANSTCIILNNADAVLELGQDSQGNQGATNTAPSDSQSPADDVLVTLNGDIE